MPLNLFALHSAFDEVVEAATPPTIPENDAIVISKFLPVADKINACPPGSKSKSGACGDCIRSVWKRVKNAEPMIGLHAVSLMDFLVKNCGVQYLAAFDEREFVIRMGDFIKAKLEDHGTNAKSTGQRRVAEALKARIQEWAEGEMKHISWFPVGPFEDRKKERSNMRGLYNVLRRQGYAFPLRRPAVVTSPADATKESEYERKEREELDFAIQASLKEAEEKRLREKLYPSSQLISNSSPTHSNHHPQQHQQQPPQQQHQQTLQQQQLLFVALYDFEAMESDELTLRAGDVINLISGEDANWWRGKQVASGKEGLFPASFVEKHDGRPKISTAPAGTTAGLSSTATATPTPETTAAPTTTTSPTSSRIDEGKIQMALHLIQQMDPGKVFDEEEAQKLQKLEAECATMGGLINSELESTDRQHLQLMQLNKKLADAMQMYHFLMVSESPRAGVQ